MSQIDAVAKLELIITDEIESDTDIDFITGSNGAKKIRVRITRNGNVGIGCTDPQAKLEIQAAHSDWMFLRQERDKDGGGFHIHNPWGKSDQPQGDSSRNRLEIGYRRANGEDLWGQFVLHGSSGNVGIGTSNPTNRLHVMGTLKVEDGKNYGLVGHDTPPNEKASFVMRSYGLAAGEPIKLQQQIGPHTRDCLTVNEEGNVGIGTSAPRGAVEISGHSGIEGMRLSLKEKANPPAGHHNSPMIKWDSTSFPGVKTIWFVRAQGNEWVLVSSESDDKNAETAITAKPDGKVEIGTTKPREKPKTKLDVKGFMICDGIVLREHHSYDFNSNDLERGTVIWNGHWLHVYEGNGNWQRIERTIGAP